MTTVASIDYLKPTFGTLGHPSIGAWPIIERSKGSNDFQGMDGYVHAAAPHGPVDTDNIVNLAITFGATRLVAQFRI
jgi:hypothetical protein